MNLISWFKNNSTQIGIVTVLLAIILSLTITIIVYGKVGQVPEYGVRADVYHTINKCNTDDGSHLFRYDITNDTKFSCCVRVRIPDWDCLYEVVLDENDWYCVDNTYYYYADELKSGDSIEPIYIRLYPETDNITINNFIGKECFEQAIYLGDIKYCDADKYWTLKLEEGLDYDQL